MAPKPLSCPRSDCRAPLAHLRVEYCPECLTIRPGSVEAQRLGDNAPRLICQHCSTDAEPTLIWPEAVGQGHPLHHQGVLNTPARCGKCGCKPFHADAGFLAAAWDFFGLWIAPFILPRLAVNLYFVDSAVRQLGGGALLRPDLLALLVPSLAGCVLGAVALAMALTRRCSPLHKGGSIVNLLPQRGQADVLIKAAGLLLAAMICPAMIFLIYPIAALVALVSLLDRYLPLLAYHSPLSGFNIFDHENWRVRVRQARILREGTSVLGLCLIAYLLVRLFYGPLVHLLPLPDFRGLGVTETDAAAGAFFDAYTVGPLLWFMASVGLIAFNGKMAEKLRQAA